MPETTAASDTQPTTESRGRRPRADSRRNREIILTTAREAFAERGASVTLDDIVKLTGLGVGTLYRHFPNRDALIEAVYLAEVEHLAEAERALAATLPAMDALRQWLLLFVDFMAAKSALKDSLGALIGGTDTLYAQSTELIAAAIGSLIARGAESGDIQSDIAPVDLLRALAGIVYSGGDTDLPARARRLVDVLIAGLRVK